MPRCIIDQARSWQVFEIGALVGGAHYVVAGVAIAPAVAVAVAVAVGYAFAGFEVCLGVLQFTNL